MKRLLPPFLFLLALCLAPGLSRALTLSAEPGPDCFSTKADDCIGGVYTVEVESIDEDTWLATFTIDLSPQLEVPATTIEQIEFKVADGYDSISIEFAPDATSNWSPIDGPLGGSGCKGKNSSFVCLDAATPLGVASTTYTWEIRFDADALLDESAWHIGARFASPDHPQGWILSAAAQPIPEPSSYLMFGIGAVIVGYAVRRRVAA